MLLLFFRDRWLAAGRQNETWTAENLPVRAFDPAGFDNTPRFDTGSAAGVWTPATNQIETWTVAS